MTISVQEGDFDVGREIADLSSGCREIGAVASFVGLVRNAGATAKEINGLQSASHSAQITAMTLEHYPGMTENALANIVAQAKARWDLNNIRVIHRIGRLLPGERIVFVGVASAHRGDAFAACEFVMDYLKTQAPFWKKEETATGGRWVDARETDDTAAARWR